jgi:hypothetical protein
MINDLNKYKKIEIDLNDLQAKHVEMEKNLNTKLDDLTRQRDQLIEQIQHYEQLQNKREQEE